VDDDLQVLHFLQDVLRLAGYNVQTAESGKTALAMIEEQPPDLLVLDLVMPDLDGFEVLRAVRNRYANLPVLVTSGFQAGVLLPAASFLGATAVIDKPMAPVRFLEIVRKLCAPPASGGTA
jgi:DNA-binding response OmpR family regulator